MIHKRNDVWFTVTALAVIFASVSFLGRKIALEESRPAVRVAGTYEGPAPSENARDDSYDYTAGGDEGAVAPIDPNLWEAERLKKEGNLDAARVVLEWIHARDAANEAVMSALASIYIESGQLKKAEQMLLRMQALNPQNARACYNLGVVQSMQGELAAAIAAYTKAVTLNPVYTRAHYNLGMIHLKMGRLEMAEQSFHAVCRYDQSAESAKAHFQLGYIQSRQNGRVQEAIASYRRAIALKPEYVQARNNLAIQLENLGDKEAAIAELEKTLQLDPAAANSLFNLGRLYSDAGKLDEAAACYRSAAKNDPSLVKAFFNLGVVEEKRGQPLLAIDAYESALAAEPGHFRAIVRLGALHRQDNPARAEKYLKQALAIDPRYASVQNSLGILCANQERYEEAVRYYDEAIRLDPEDSSAYFNKALALEALRQNKKAADIYQAILAMDAAHLKSRCKLVRLYAVMGDSENALAQAVKIEKVAPGDPLALAALCEAYVLMNLPDKAAVCQKKLVEQGSGDVSAHRMLGDIYSRLKRYPEAIEAYRPACEAYPTNVSLLKAIGRACRGAGDPNQAQVYFDRAAEQESNQRQ
ncbi:MAG: tetratricopeptide repeat protein [Planctomycetales bacterium]|nr:tetratricopeptide repeat protein [Planctomycetales bacterium]